MVVVSAGFYVRSLAHDIGQVLGCGAHLEALRRTRAGRFRIEDAATLDALEAGRDRRPPTGSSPVNALLADMPAVTLTDEGLRRAANGNTLAPGHLDGAGAGPGRFGQVPSPGPGRRPGRLLAVAERRARRAFASPPRPEVKY